VYVYPVMLGHCAAMVTAENRVSSRQVLSPNPSARAIDAFCGPHHAFWPDVPVPLLALAPLPVLAADALPVLAGAAGLPPALLLPLLHAAAVRERAAAAAAVTARRSGRTLGLALLVGVLIVLTPAIWMRFFALGAEGLAEGCLA
jgi:hypothetical protein